MTIRYVASPTLASFHKSNAFVRGLMGPIGSGKSTGCCWEIFRRAQEQKPDADGVRRTRWAVIRNTYRELADTTHKTWDSWFGKEEVGRWHPADMMHALSFTMGDGTRVEAEVLFRALDRPQDVKKLLSLDLTGAWVNEAREVPKAVIDALQGRVGRYPAHKDGGPTWFGVIMDTNPPDRDHWWAVLAEKDTSSPTNRELVESIEQAAEELRGKGLLGDGQALFEFFRQPGGESPGAENLEHLIPGYYTRLKAGKRREWVKVYVDGEYGFVTDGRAVFPEFREHVHVRNGLKADRRRTVHVGLDFGLTPAATFGQRDHSGRWVVLHEVTTESMGAVRFAELLKRETAEVFPGCRFEFTGDPAGDDRSQVDERTAFMVLRAAGIDAKPAPSNDPSIRIEAVSKALGRLIDGEPGLLIDTDCKMLVKGMAGGYNYKRLQVAGDERFHDKPDKNRFSHVCDALQYMLLGAGEAESILYPQDEEEESTVSFEIGRSAVGGY